MVISKMLRPTLLALPLALLAAPGMAQDYPAREIRVVCGYAAGTGADILVRFFADKLRPLTGQTMLVENKVGAFTAIAAEYVARARPDGYTLFITAGNSTMAGNPHQFNKLPYDPLKDFAPITTLVTLPFVLTVKPDSSMKTAQDLITQMKAKGDKASYGAPNTISVAAGELLKNMAGLSAVQVTYKSTPEALTDLIGNQIDYLWADGTFAGGQIANNRLRGLAVTTGKRSAAFPDLPTLDEAGVKGYDLTAWWGAWFPANTPKPIVDKMNGWLTQILASQEAKDYLTKTAAATPFPGTPQSTHDYLVKETKFWGEVFTLAKVQKQ